MTDRFRPKRGLAAALKAKGLKKLPQRLLNPLPLRPEILLHPNVPKPLHGVNPRSIMGTNWWNRTRLQVYKSTNRHCLACGVHESEAKSRHWMEAHETYEIDYKRGIAKFIEIVPLCNYCHNYIHSGRLQALLDKGEIHHSRFVGIIQHGDRVLREVGLSKVGHKEREAIVANLEASGGLAEWSSWRLLFNRKKYPPLYKNFEEWSKAMNGESE